MEQQRLHQEERVRRALERAKAEPKKKVFTRKAHITPEILWKGNGEVKLIECYLGGFCD